MTDQELRRLKRADLNEILYYLQKENDELREENEKLKSRIDAWLAGKPAGETADGVQISFFADDTGSELSS